MSAEPSSSNAPEESYDFIMGEAFDPTYVHDAAASTVNVRREMISDSTTTSTTRTRSSVAQPIQPFAANLECDFIQPIADKASGIQIESAGWTDGITIVRKQPKSAAAKLGPGRAYIFNHFQFDPYPEQQQPDRREGTEIDVAKLEKTFQQLQIEYITWHDRTVSQMDAIAREICTTDFTHNSCIVIVILSHGTTNDRIYAKDKLYSIDDTILAPILENDTLKNKPKIFFIQACKGQFELRQDNPLPPRRPAAFVMKCYATFEGAEE